MDPETLVLQYLDEAHATEAALVTNLAAHIAMAPKGKHRRLLERHLEETREQVENIERRRGEIGDGNGRGIVAASFGLARDAVGQALVLTKGPIDAVRASSSSERMLKNAKDECATEALEIATYDALEAAAKAAGDTTTARLAASHRRTEERMLRDLRALIPALAIDAFQDRTGVRAKSTTTRSATSGRATSTSRKRSQAAKKAARTRKANAEKSSSSRSRSKAGSS